MKIIVSICIFLTVQVFNVVHSKQIFQTKVEIDGKLLKVSFPNDFEEEELTGVSFIIIDEKGDKVVITELKLHSDDSNKDDENSYSDIVLSIDNKEKLLTSELIAYYKYRSEGVFSGCVTKKKVLISTLLSDGIK